MIAPLAGAVATWVLVTRTYARRPEQLTPLMVAAFGGKLVFFGAYVSVMLGVLSLRPLPFVISFTAYFIALHLFEALCLQRLFGGTLTDDGDRRTGDGADRPKRRRKGSMPAR